MHLKKCISEVFWNREYSYVFHVIFQLQYDPVSDVGYSALEYDIAPQPEAFHAMKMKRKSVQALRMLAQQILAARQVMSQERKMLPRLF